MIFSNIKLGVFRGLLEEERGFLDWVVA